MTYLSKPKEIKSSQAALRTDLYLTPRIQSLSFSANLDIVSVYELGNKRPIEKVSGTPKIALSISMLDYGSINFINQLTDTFKGNINNINTSNGQIIDEDLENSHIDFNLLINEDTNENITHRNCWFGSCSLNSISGNYSVDGLALESFDFSATSQVWFLDDLKNMLSVPLKLLSTTMLIPNIDGYEFDSILVDTINSILVCNGIELDTTNYTISSSGVVQRVGDLVFSEKNRYRLLANILDQTGFPELTTLPNSIGGVQEKEIEIVLWDGSDTPEYGVSNDEKLLRVQDVNYEILFDKEDLKEIYTGIYGKSSREKRINVVIGAIASDLQMWAYGTNNRNAWKLGSDINRISIEDFVKKKDLKLRISIFRSADQRNVNNLLKSILFEDGSVIESSSDISVLSKKMSSMTINFEKVTFLGTGYAGREEQIPQFDISISQETETIIVDVISEKEYYYEIGWQKLGDGITWTYSEWHLFTSSEFTKYINKSDYFDPDDTCVVRVRAKDQYNSISNWETINIEVA